MHTLADTAIEAVHKNGHIIIRFASGVEIKFAVSKNKRLARGTDIQLNNIEVSPCGLHWPDLDEDLSLKGLLQGDYGQFAK